MYAQATIKCEILAKRKPKFSVYSRLSINREKSSAKGAKIVRMAGDRDAVALVFLDEKYFATGDVFL